MDYNNFSIENQHHIGILFNWLNEGKFVTEVDLSNRYINDDDQNKLLKILFNTQSITSLNLRNTSIISDKFINKHLVKLDLSNNRSIKDISYLSNFLSNNLNSLEFLDLSETCIEGSSPLGNMIANNTTLTTLKLSDIFIIFPFIKSLKKNNTLKYLQLKNCGLKDASTFELANWIKQNKSLLSLDLSKNRINFKTLLNEGLQYNNTLKELNLSDNNIDNLIDHCFGKTKLEYLDLSNNTLCDSDCDLIIRAELSLHKINLENNFCTIKKIKLVQDSFLHQKKKLLLLIRKNCPDSLLSEDNFPLDLFKIIIGLI